MKKLLIVVGAGASLEFGMPSVSEIDALIENWAKEILPLKEDRSKSVYTWVKERLSNYIIQNKNNRINNLINFENLLYTIQSLSALLKDKEWKNFNNRLNPFIELNELPYVISHGKEKIANGDDLHYLHSYLVDKLLEYLREKCKTLGTEKKNELKNLNFFFDSLKKDFEIGFINLNYDNVILSALPDLKTGFDKQTGEFNREEFYNTKWGFCYHLHGSVYFDMKGGKDTEMHKILWNSDLFSQFSQNSSGRNLNYTSEGIDHLNSCIITGLDKTNQLLREPFGQYYMQFDRLVYESDAILFMGYGFNDLHLNKIIPFIRYDEKKKRKVVIIDWAANNEAALSYRHDGWSFGVFTTIPFNCSEMGDGRSIEPKSINYFKKGKLLEKSSNPEYPIAIWYNGLLEACNYPNKIKDELK